MRALKKSALVTSLFILGVRPALGQIRLGPESTPELADVETGSWFGYSLDVMGDLDGNGVADLLVGAPRDSEAGKDAGAVWILFMNADGSVGATRKISANNLDARGPSNDRLLGSRVSALDDFRDTGSYEIAVASPSFGRFVRLDADGGVLSTDVLPHVDSPEPSVVVIGDIDGNGAEDLAETRQNSRTGAVEIVPYLPNGMPDQARIISIGEGEGGWPDVLDLNDDFGWHVTRIKDLNGDGRDELVVGAPGDDDLFQETGAVYVLFLAPSGLVASYQKISATEGGFRGELNGGDSFGKVVTDLGDLDKDGFNELAVGAPGDGAGSIWVLSLNSDGTVRHESRIRLADYDIPIEDVVAGNFELGLAVVPDFGGDGIPDLAIGLPHEGNAGAVWLLPALADLASAVGFFEVDPNEASVGAHVPISVQASAIGGIARVELSFRPGGDLEFLSATMHQEGEFYAYDIPRYVSSRAGLEYYVTIENVAGKESRQPPDGFVSVSLRVPEGVSVPVPTGDAADGYRIVSIPLEYENLSLLDMLESNLGTSDKANWRAFVLTGGRVTELSNRAVELTPGTAFWLLSSRANLVLNAGSGRTVRTDRPVKIRLLRGWNLIGNPFSFPIAVSALRTESGDEIDILSYEGDWGSVVDSIQTNSGYALFSARGDTLIIDPRLRAATSNRSSTDAVTGMDWSVAVHAASGRSRDLNNRFGASPNGQSGWDAFDSAEPPHVGDFFSVSFRNEFPGLPTTHLQDDIRASPSDGNRWLLEVSAAHPRATTLRFDDVSTVPDALDVILVDASTGIQLDLRTTDEYSLIAGTTDHPRSLEIVVGSDLAPPLGETARETDLFEAFPNPFTFATTVRFTLSTPERCRIRVYDVLGKVVSTLHEDRNLREGLHTIVWNGLTRSGSPAAPGLYVIRLESKTGRRSAAVTLSR